MSFCTTEKFLIAVIITIRNIEKLSTSLERRGILSSKFKVGDKISYIYDGKKYKGTVVQVDRTSFLAKLEGFPYGHNGNGYPTNDYWWIDTDNELVTKVKIFNSLE